MAVHCGACGERIDNAAKNFGHFSTNADFNGWDRDEETKRAHIHDTCASCSATLRSAVTKAANAIAKKHHKVVSRMRADQDAQRAHESAVKKEKAEFEATYAEHQRTKGPGR